MKKLVISLLTVLFVSPAFAQMTSTEIHQNAKIRQDLKNLTARKDTIKKYKNEVVLSSAIENFDIDSDLKCDGEVIITYTDQTKIKFEFINVPEDTEVKLDDSFYTIKFTKIDGPNFAYQIFADADSPAVAEGSAVEVQSGWEKAGHALVNAIEMTNPRSAHQMDSPSYTKSQLTK